MDASDRHRSVAAIYDEFMAGDEGACIFGGQEEGSSD